MTIHGAQGGPELGKTWYGDQVPDSDPANWGPSIGKEGLEASLDNVTPDSFGGPARNYRNGKRRRARLMRNLTGSALLPGQVVAHQANYHGRRVGALSGAAGEFAGVVDENLPATRGCPPNDLCWVIFEGETLCNKGATAFTDGDFVDTGASGTVVAAAATAGQQDAAHVGRVVADAAVGDAQVLVHTSATH